MSKHTYFILLFTFFISSICHAQITSLHEDFSTCNGILPAGWQQYSVTGSDTWTCTAAGYTNKAVYMNGYSGANYNVNEDWLISPLLDLSAFSSPNLAFWNRTKFNGSAIEIKVSSNYIGSGNPNVATWNNLSIALAAINSDIWYYSSNINLTVYKSQPFYIAIKYISSNVDASLWRIDDMEVYENALSLSKKFINVGECGVGDVSSSKSFQFTMNGLNGSLVLNAPYPFELSKDNVNFATQLSYNNNASGINQTVYARIKPLIADKVYRDSIQFVYNGNNIKTTQYILGTSLPNDQTLRVFNWNMRWFGEPSWCNCDTALAKNNAIQIMKDANADVYCLQEFVNVAQLNFITQQLGAQFSSIVSPYGSGASNPASGFYSTCQKLAYIYNTNKIQNLGSFGLLASTYPADTTVNSAYYCFSSGRFPFIMKAKLLLANGNNDTVFFANIHAKASGTQSDYDRRACATSKMTDSLNTLFPNNQVIVIGDFNDFIEGTNVVGNVLSPYKYLLDNGFTGITLPSKYVGQSTYVGSSDFIIDNIVCKNNMMNKYVDSSFFIFTETEKYINDYRNTTSDHYPCMSYFKYNFPNTIRDIQKENHIDFTIQNPSNNILKIHSNLNEKTSLTIFDMLGKIVYKNNINIQPNFEINIPILNKGIYFVMIKTNDKFGVEKWLVE